MNPLSQYAPEDLLRKYKTIRREALAGRADWLDKRVAILGGYTTADIRKMLELHLLSNGIRAVFYESEYAQYYMDAMFGSDELSAFSPDFIFVCTSNRNIERYPEPGDGADASEDALCAEFERYARMWDKLREDYGCPVIQNNFEYPYYRIMGNAEASFAGGRVNFINRLNLKLAEYARERDGFYINDINYLSAYYGLESWSDPFYWHMYKYALCLPAIPVLAKSVSNIIKSILGKNKKAFALDLDNTLWGGIVGDDGAENLEMGQETSAGQVYAEFQAYIKAHKKLGVILNVVSKNEAENALAGLNRPDSLLSPDDFIMIKANWEPKSENLQAIAHELALLPESFVFVDDNPAERAIINQELPDVPTPAMTKPERYIGAIDREGYFEVTSLTKDDAARIEQYKSNAERGKLQTRFADYGKYLESLEMKAEIRPFAPMYMSRIAQLTNKSNQFNLTTLRLTQGEIENYAADSRYITLYGKLADKFGDNGVVSVVIGEIDGETIHIRLWLMSCRVLKREMESAMLDELARASGERGAKELRGYYYPTAKNAMVKDFYDKMGFTQIIGTEENGNKAYSLALAGYTGKQAVIEVSR